MSKVLIEFGVDLRFVVFAVYVTISTVLIFSIGIPLIILLSEFITGELSFKAAQNSLGFTLILLIPSAVLAVKALPFTFPASLVGWALTFRISTTFGYPRYAASMIAGLSAATFSSFTFGYWFELVLTSRLGHDLNPSILVLPFTSILVLPSTLLAALLVGALVYRPQKATF